MPKHDVSTEARDSHGRWTKTGRVGAFSNYNPVDDVNLVPPDIALPELPTDIKTLLNRIVRFRRFAPNLPLDLRDPRTTGPGLYKPKTRELAEATKEVWSLRALPDMLQTTLFARTADADYSGYIKKYHTNLDDDIIKLSKMVEVKLGTPKGDAILEKDSLAKREIRRPRNSRRECTPLTKGSGDDLLNLTSNTIDKMTPLFGMSTYLPYRCMEQAQVLYGNSNFDSNEWKAAVLVEWRREVSRVSFHSGGGHFDKLGRVVYENDTSEDALPIDERMQRLSVILNKWADTRDKQLQFYRQWYRDRYQGIIAAARKEYESAYSDGATTAAQWVQQLQQKYGGHYASDFIAIHGQYNPRVTQAIDDAFKAVPLGPDAWAKLTEAGTQPVVQVAQSNADLVGGTRSNYRDGAGITLEGNANSDTIAHEYGHHIERIFGLGPTLSQWTIDRADYKPMQLGFAYGGDETAYPDNFITKYVGKVYPGGTHSEVLSMGIQAALTHANDFIAADPAHFFLTMGVLLGLGKSIDVPYPELPKELAKSEVKRPGSRGGHPWLDDKGHWRYDKRPLPHMGRTVEETVHNYFLARRQAANDHDNQAKKRYDALGSLAEAYAGNSLYPLGSVKEMVTDPDEGYGLSKQEVDGFLSDLSKQPHGPVPDIAVSPSARATIDRAVRAVKDRQVEHMVVVDPASGKVVAARKGSANEVMARGESRFYGLVYIHNHPLDKNESQANSFSLSDVRTACQERFAELLAVGGDGRVFTMQPPVGKGWNTAFFQREIAPAYQDAEKQIVSGSLPERSDRIWQAVAAKTGLRYTVSPLVESAHVAVPKWKPTMTEQEAEAWVAHSAYRQPVWHVTTQEAADSIRKEGFKIGNQTNFGREFGGGVYLALDEKTRQFYEKLLRDSGRGTPVTLEGRVNVKKILKLDLTKLPASEDYDYDESGRHSVAEQLPGGLQEFKHRCDTYYESWHDKVYKQALEKYPSGTENDFGTQKYYQYQRQRQLYIKDLEKQHDMVGWDDQKLVESIVLRQMLQEAGYDALLVTERPGDNPQWSLDILGGNQLVLPDASTVTVAKSLFGINFRHPNKLTYMLVLSALDYTTLDQPDSRQLTRSLGSWLWKHGRTLIKADSDVVDDKPKEHRDIPAGARWITVHPNGRDQEGHPVLIVPAHGRPNTWHVVGGADGKLTHMEVHLNSPEVWKQHAIERAKARHEKEVESGVTPDTKAAIREAKEQSQRLYVRRVAQRMGWQDYSDKSSDDFLAQAGGDKARAAMLAHQYLRSHLAKANEAVKGLRNRLAVDREAFAGADLRLANGETDPYRADENDLIPGDISQRLTESQKVGNTEAATYYQNALDSLNHGDTEAAQSYLTAGNKSAGVRQLTVQDILPPAKVTQPTGQESTGKKAVNQVRASGELAPEALEQRIAAVTTLTKGNNPIDQYTGQLELEALQQAVAAIDTKDPTKTDARQAAQAYLQAEKFRAIRQKMNGDKQKFQAWKEMREKAIDNAAAVRALRTQGTTGAETADTDVADMQNARDLLAAKVLYDSRIKALKTAQRSLDPQAMHTVVQDQDTLETDADWDKVYNQATREAFEQIQQAKETNTAIELDTAADNPTNFLRAVGDGEPVDQQHIQRYIQFGQQSALDLIGEVTGGKPTLATTAYQVLGAKTSAKLMANYYASTMKPEEFKAVQEGVADYHTAREFDVANGALVAANAILDTAHEYKRESDADVDNLYEAAKYNKLRMEAVDRALATIGTAYGELNATAEMNYAFMAARPQQGELALDAGTDDVGQLVKIAHALNLDDQDYQIVDKVRAKGKTVSPHGLVLTTSGVGKLFHTATPLQRQRRARLMNIRAGGEDDLLPDGTKAANGWLPAYFANWPAALRNTATVQPVASPKAVQGQTLQGNPADVTKAVSYALGEQPFATVGFKDTLDANDLKTLQAFYATRRGIATEQPGTKQTVNASKTASTDIFGNPILAQAAAGKISDDKASVAWRELVHRVGTQRAIATVQNAIKSDFLAGFVPIYNAMTNQKLATAQEKLTPDSDFARLTIGPEAEQQLTGLVQKLAWRYPKGQGAAEYEIPGISMSGRFVAQQRVIKSLEASGGLRGKEGGRLGAFLGVGCVDGGTRLYDPVRKVTKTFHDWMTGGVSPFVCSCDEVSGRYVTTPASVPFIKGYEMMYEVRTESRQRIVVTGSHRFLTPQGWRQLSSLFPFCDLILAPLAPEPHDVGVSKMQECVPFHLLSKQESFPLEYGQDVRGWSHTTLGESQHHALAEMKDSPRKPPHPTAHDQIVSIVPFGYRLVYDITVPLYANYVAEGLVNHNSGKTNTSLGGYTNLLAKGKARQAIFAMPSAVLGQFGPAIAGVIDPNSPVKWSADTSGTAASRAKSLADPNTHIVALTHESLRDDTIKALGKLWNISPKEATTRFMGFTRTERARAVKQAFDTMGWSKRLDYLSIDEGHQALNRKGKENSILANVFDAIADNSKYYMPQTGTPSKNDTSEVWDWLSKLRPDEYPPEQMQEFLGRHQLLSSEAPRLDASKKADIAGGAEHKRNWTSNAAAAALQQELGENFYSSSAPIKVPVTHQSINVPLADQPDDEKVKATTDDTLPELMQKGLQKSAYDRVGILEQNIKAAAYKKDWPAVAQQIRELTTTTTTAKNGKVSARNVYTLPDGKEVAPGSPEEADITKRLVTATAMMRDAAYNRVLNTMPNGNAKTKALMGMLDDMGKQYAADDNQPRDKFGNPVPASQRVKGKPVIVFTRSLDAVDNLVRTLKAHGYNAVGISGRDNGADKLRKKELFQPSGKTKPQVNVLVMSDAMSAGIDLPRAEAVIHYDTGDTAKVMEQRSARAIRLSTKHPVSVYSLVSDTPYEKRRVDRVARKGALGDVIQNPAETLDDSGLAWYINQRRITHARQEHENPPIKNNQESALPIKGVTQAKDTADAA